MELWSGRQKAANNRLEAAGLFDSSKDYILYSSSQLSMWSYAESNRGPLACHASALPTELQPPIRHQITINSVIQTQ